MIDWGEFGHYALILAAAVAAIAVVSALFAADKLRSTQLVLQASKLQFYLCSFSMLSLGIAFYDNDFSLQYVANHSNSLLPWYYRITAIWGGHEGSLLLWIWMLNLWTYCVAIFSRSLPAGFRTRVLGILSYIALGFYLFILLTSNPFARYDFAPFDGRDLNPLLQDPGLIFHPPLLYAGYVGFAVAFAFVLAGLWQGRLDSLWLRRARPWTLWAWLSLTLGISLGSYWAYYELGWGGWWFWDPVENASLMPWLLGTALIHSLIASEKRSLFRIWTALLAISTFSLCLIGTFLVRSGVLTSVHAFASDATRGIFILALLIAISLPALILLIMRANTISHSGDYAIFSKETGLLINNWLLSGLCLVVFVGTLYPLVADVLSLGKISVGAPYFNRFTVPLALLMLFLMGFYPLLRWKRDRLKRLKPHLGIALVFAAVLTAICMKWLLPHWQHTAALSIFLSAFALAAVLIDYLERIKQQGSKALKPRGAIAGMLLAHAGLIVMIFGITGASLYDEERDISIKEGDSIQMHDYRITLTGLQSYSGANYRSVQGRFLLQKDSDAQFAALLLPAKRNYFSSTMPMTESDRLVTPSHDVYIAMGEEIGANTWAVRVQYKPFISWVWIGSLIMALGGIVAAFDRAYRSRLKEDIA